MSRRGENLKRAAEVLRRLDPKGTMVFDGVAIRELAAEVQVAANEVRIQALQLEILTDGALPTREGEVVELFGHSKRVEI